VPSAANHPFGCLPNKLASDVRRLLRGRVLRVVRAIVAVLKMVMLKAMERGIMSKAAGRTCCLTELNCLRARAEL